MRLIANAISDIEKWNRAALTENCLRRLPRPALGERQVDHALVVFQSRSANADALRFRRRAKLDGASFTLRCKDLRLFLRLGAGDLGLGFGAGRDNLLLAFIANAVHRFFGGDCVVLGFHRRLDRRDERL